MRFSLSNAVSAICVVAVLPSCIMAATQTVMVGMNGQLVFSPSNITASVGDTVQFMFMSPGKNHSVTQSNFAQPCDPLENGSDSGFFAVPANATYTPETAPTWSIMVNTTNPLWMHCAQTKTKSHCEAGMVFSINANAEKTFDQYLANAMNSSSSAAAASSTSPTAGSAGGLSSTNTSSSAAEENQSTPPAANSGSPKIATSKRALGLFAVTSVMGAMLFY